MRGLDLRISNIPGALTTERHTVKLPKATTQNTKTVVAYGRWRVQQSNHWKSLPRRGYDMCSSMLSLKVLRILYVIGFKCFSQYLQSEHRVLTMREVSFTRGLIKTIENF